MFLLKITGLVCLVLLAHFLSLGYSRFRQTRLYQVDALLRLLLQLREDIQVYHTFRSPWENETFSPLFSLGLGGEGDLRQRLGRVISNMTLFSQEKKTLLKSLHHIGEGNIQSEVEKLETMIDNVKSILQNEEKEGKKSSETVRIVLFTIALALVIILL